MNPKIDNIFLDGDILEFTISNIDVTIANTLRRTILSDIYTCVFKTYPYNECDANIEINTTRLNNEILKQRLSCIPIHITDDDFPIDNIILIIDKENTSNIIEYVTTEDFQLYDTNTKAYIPKEDVSKIFPMNNITKNYIDFARLRPRISDEIPGERLKLTCKISKGCARDDSMFNVACNSSYGYTLDKDKIDKLWNEKENELKEKKMSIEEIEYIKNDWYALDAKRIYVTDENTNKPNSFDFVIQTTGVYSPYQLIKKACNIIYDNLEEFSVNSNLYEINISDTTINNCYDIILYNKDHTFGKLLEYLLYINFYETGKLSFCGFIKKHPHDDYCIIRIAYNEVVEKEEIYKDISYSCKYGIDMYTEIEQLFIE